MNGAADIAAGVVSVACHGAIPPGFLNKQSPFNVQVEFTAAAGFYFDAAVVRCAPSGICGVTF